MSINLFYYASTTFDALSNKELSYKKNSFTYLLKHMKHKKCNNFAVVICHLPLSQNMEPGRKSKPQLGHIFSFQYMPASK